MNHIKVSIRILVPLLLAAIAIPVIDAKGVECIPVGPGSLQPRHEQVVQIVSQGFHSRLAKSSRDDAIAGSSRRSTNESVRQKRSYQIECPTQKDQSLAYDLKSDPEGYPIELISNELFVRSLPVSDLLFQCLGRQVIDETQGPVIEPQPLLDNGTTCPQALSQLWTYNSVAYGNVLCWAMANFQEDILYNANCTGKPCLGCRNTYPAFDFNTEYRKICFPLYRTVSLWAFCPSLQENQRIVRDRIVIPSDCSCTSVPCKRRTSQYRHDVWDHPFFNSR